MKLAVTTGDKLESASKKGLGILLAVSIALGSVLSPVSADGAENVVEAEAVSQEIGVDSLSVTNIKEYESNELVVVYKKEGTTILELPEGANEEELTEKCSLIEVDTKKELRETIALLQEDKEVGFVQPNYTYKPLYTNDTFSDRQWAYYGYYNIGMEEAWAAGPGENKEAIVAIIDVGIDYNHEDLAPVMWVNEDEIPDDGEDNDGNGYEDDIYGYNFFDDDSVVCDYVYSEIDGEYVEDHGTHVAGIIAAVADNGTGVAGVASRSNVKLMSLKVLGDDQNGFGIRGDTGTIISAIKYAEDNGASICNMSLGYSGFDKALYQTMKESELLFICAAGNGATNTEGRGWSIDEDPEYPAAFDLENIVSVANMNENGFIDESSCYGEVSVDIAAPGTDIASTVVAAPTTIYRDSKYMLFTGTSMSAPMVTGTAALLASYFDEITNMEIKEAILGGATVNPNFANKVAENRMLNVAGALNYYKNRFHMEIEIADVSENSNNKRVTAQIVNNSSPIEAVVYAKGEKNAEYFGEGEGVALNWNENQASFKVNETGTYTIYVLCEDGTELTEQVTVEVPVVKKVKLSATKKTLKKGKTYKLKAKVTPTDMYVKLVYKTSNSKVASVNSKGTITAKKKGKAKITVYAKDGNTMKKAVCTVTVTN